MSHTLFNQIFIHWHFICQKYKIDCSTTYATWVCTSSVRANQQHWPIIYPAFPTTLVEAMWDVVWLYWLYVWRCLFSIIKAMICIGSGWSAVGWTGTLHLVTHTHTDTLKVYQSCSYYSYKPLVHSCKDTHHFEGNCQTGGVCGAFVMVTTLDHAALTAGLWLTFFENSVELCWKPF